MSSRDAGVERDPRRVVGHIVRGQSGRCVDPQLDDALDRDLLAAVSRQRPFEQILVQLRPAARGCADRARWSRVPGTHALRRRCAVELC